MVIEMKTKRRSGRAEKVKLSAYGKQAELSCVTMDSLNILINRSQYFLGITYGKGALLQETKSPKPITAQGVQQSSMDSPAPLRTVFMGAVLLHSSLSGL